MMDGIDDTVGVYAVFSEYGDYLTKENDTREELKSSVKSVEQAGREIHSILQKVHRPGGMNDISKIAQLSEDKFVKIRELVKIIDSNIPAGSYWRYSQIWSNCNSWISFLATFTLYLKTEKLPSRTEISEMLGMASGGETVQMYLDIEEYLLGLCHLSNELSRLTVNSVTSGDYDRPVRISEFLNSLHTGFRLLNLKNDNLRKRFDSIKYDLKKVEEVIYDVTIHGLKKVDVNKDNKDATQQQDQDLAVA